MDIESIMFYCLSLPLATEDMAFGDACLLLRVGGRIFACIGLTGQDYFVVKADPEKAADLRARYNGIRPAWHWNKKYWIQISLREPYPAEMIQSIIRHSYSEVVKKLPKSFRSAHPEIITIS